MEKSDNRPGAMLDKISARAREAHQKLDKMSPDVAARREPKPDPSHRSVKHIESRLESPPQTKGSKTTGKVDCTGETDSDNNCKNEEKKNGMKRANERPGATLDKILARVREGITKIERCPRM